MTKDSIQELLNHIRCRQERFGPHEGFKFHSYVKGKNIVKAQYGVNANTHKAAERNKKQQIARKQKKNVGKKGKKNGKTTDALAEGSTNPGSLPNGPAVPWNVTAANECITAASGNVAAATRNAIAADTLDEQHSPLEPQIDPALLSEVLATQVQNIATDRIQHPQDSGGYVDDIGMQLLIANGFQNTIPVNGPQDGPPKYFVSAAAIDFLSNLTRVESTSDDIVPENIVKSTNINTKGGRKHKSNREVTVDKPRRSERVRENDKGQERKTRSRGRVDGAKKR